MRQFVGLLVVLFFSIPLGLSVAGCGHATPVQYCNGSGFGPTAGQVKSITLAQNLIATGESLNYGQIGPGLSATSVDCFNNAVSISSYTYSTTDMSIADVNPATGAVCAGTWNRNTGGNVASYTICTPAVNPTNHTAFITAAASGATSNQIAVFIHPTVSGIVLGPTSDCVNDPDSSCTRNGVACTPNLTGAPLPNPLPPTYAGASCLSQNVQARLVARVYANGNTSPANNITCQVGPLAYGLQGSSNIGAIDANGFITANQPGSAVVTATVSNSSSGVNAGFFSTCPPASISLSAVNQPANSTDINVGLNTPQAFTATVTDTKGKVINGLSLEFNSTLPVNFPTSSGTVTPAFPGAATITAACVPPSCNPAPFSQIAYLGNGTPVTSNGITVTAPGSASEVLYMASTGSQYIVSENFNTGQIGSPIKLPFAPNSLVISQDGSTIYMGSSGGLMIFNTASGSVTNTFQTVQGLVLSVAPDNTYAVVTDPTRQTVSLVTSAGAVNSTFNGVGTHAAWSPDSNTLYVTTSTNQLLTYTTFTGWQSRTDLDEVYTDVAVTVPHAGAYFAGNVTEGRTVCPSTGLSTAVTPPSTNPSFFPLADRQNAPTDRLAYTTNGQHLLGATAQTNPAQLQDVVVNLPTTNVNGTTTIAACPQAPSPITPGYFTSTSTSHPLNGLTASSITGVVPASNSSVAFVTYTGSGGVLPLYVPASGSLTDVALSGGSSTAPIAGVFSTDNKTFYAGTSGDNNVHLITVTGTTAKDTGVITPNLPGLNGGIATPNLIVQRPLRAQS